MAPKRVQKPSGWQGGSDDFDVLAIGMGGRMGINEDSDLSLEDLRNRKNCHHAGEEW